MSSLLIVEKIGAESDFAMREADSLSFFPRGCDADDGRVGEDDVVEATERLVSDGE